MNTPTPLERSFIVAGLLIALPCNDINAAIFPIATDPGSVTNPGGVEMAVSLAFDGTNYLVGIQGDETAQDNITAQLVGPTGALIGSRIKVAGPYRTGGAPSVAFDGTNYLLVWEYEGASDPNLDLYGQRVSRAGALVGSAFAISTAPAYQHLDTQTGPVAYGGGKYLIVYRDDRTGTNAVRGQLVSTSGTLSGSEIVISADALAATQAAVAFDGTRFLVVYQKRTNAVQERYDTVGRFISTAGAQSAEFVISQTPSASFNPLTLVFNGSNYLVTWNKDIGPGYPAASDFDIHARLVSPSGTLSGNEIALVADAGDQVLPGVSFDGVNYLLSWTEGAFGSPNTIKFQFLNPVLQPLGQPFELFATQGTNWPFFGVTIFDGTRFTVVGTLANLDANFNFTSGDVYGTFIPKSTATPRLDVAGPRVGTQFPLRLTGTPGIDYTIQTSATLGTADWTTLVTTPVSAATGTLDLTDTAATTPSRFYRAVKP